MNLFEVIMKTNNLIWEYLIELKPIFQQLFIIYFDLSAIQ